MADVADLSPPELMFKLIAGFWVSQAIGVAADLALADRLAEKPATADELAEATGAEPSALLRLLRALTTVGVFCREDGGRFALTPLGATSGLMLALGAALARRARRLKRATLR